MKMIEIETKRLILRPFILEDAKDVQKLAGNKRVSQTTQNIPYPYENGMAEKWILRQIKNMENGTEVAYAITNKDLKKLLGTVSLVKIKSSYGELGYWIGEPYWGQGYCTEATKAFIQFVFTNMRITKIAAEHLSSNPASGCVMNKVGMHYTYQVEKFDRNGQVVNFEYYEIEKT